MEAVMDGAVTEAQLRDLVTGFYGEARRNPRLGPIFAAHVADWDAHIETLTRFWSSVMLTSGLYKGLQQRELAPAQVRSPALGRCHRADVVEPGKVRLSRLVLPAGPGKALPDLWHAARCVHSHGWRG
jgi:hypothetical protein